MFRSVLDHHQLYCLCLDAELVLKYGSILQNQVQHLSTYKTLNDDPISVERHRILRSYDFNENNLYLYKILLCRRV
jgi:hypothetical protein